MELIHKPDFSWFKNALIDLKIYTPVSSSILPYNNNTDSYFLLIAEENYFDNSYDITTMIKIVIPRLIKEFNLDINKTIFIEKYSDFPHGSTYYPFLNNLVLFSYNIENGIQINKYLELYRDEIEILKTGKLQHKNKATSQGYYHILKKYSHLIIN